MRRMHAAGHHIASHTWTHRNLNEVNSTIQRTEIIYNEMSFRNLFGWIPTYMRPPYLECNAGSGCQNLLRTLGYHIINVNIDTKDYMYDSPATIQTAKDRFSSGVSTNAVANSYIELSHDVHYQTVVNLTQFMIDTAKARGYRLVTVGECLNDPKENWYRPAGGAISSSIAPGTTRTTTTTSVPTSSTVRDSSIFHFIQCSYVHGEGFAGPNLRWNQWLHMSQLELWQLLFTIWVLRLKPHILRNGLPIGLRILCAASFGRERHDQRAMR
ncbi:Chitin deacetylase ARB_04768 [Colletotrichum liriopes]|uniref:Chitin deacetylase ARB_04768 n=1 Tax=Colletotrichum liriopes TaxID=708192 RepID=A0AA37LR07_9PEZI|nr:Chitin deacetylase ARB_04768 [Colletotrichum liriopes]